MWRFSLKLAQLSFLQLWRSRVVLGLFSAAFFFIMIVALMGSVTAALRTRLPLDVSEMFVGVYLDLACAVLLPSILLREHAQKIADVYLARPIHTLHWYAGHYAGVILACFTVGIGVLLSTALIHYFLSGGWPSATYFQNIPLLIWRLCMTASLGMFFFTLTRSSLSLFAAFSCVVVSYCQFDTYFSKNITGGFFYNAVLKGLSYLFPHYSALMLWPNEPMLSLKELIILKLYAVCYAVVMWLLVVVLLRKSHHFVNQKSD